MLDVENLTATIDDRQILTGLDLHVGAGEVHGSERVGQEHAGPRARRA